VIYYDQKGLTIAAKFVNVDRDTPMMFPPDLRKWLPEDSMVHFIVDTVDLLDVRNS